MAQPLQHFLGSGASLERLHDHTRRLVRLQAALSRALPGLLANSCNVANLKDDVLVVMARNSAVAVRLKQMTPSLLEHLGREGFNLSDIQVRLQIETPQAPITPPEPRVIGQRGYESLRQFAATLPADSPLRESLEQLVARAVVAERD